MGDPAGIGPEVCVKMLKDERVTSVCNPIVLGDFEWLQRSAQLMEISLADIALLERNEVPDEVETAAIVNFETPGIGNLSMATESQCAGLAAWSYIEKAIIWSQNRAVDAVTTGPINKLSLSLAEIKFPGHTEIFAAKTNAKRYCMLQYSDEVTCAFVTTHIGYSQVPQEISSDRIYDVIELAQDAVARLNQRPARLMVCGLNPHAGEQGLFGRREEENLIAPAVERARSAGFDVVGPLPPDTCFIPANRAAIDCFICMYHDQGHIPLKALAFDRAVNITLGLPVIRTSVDHGTAFDIVGKGIANAESMVQAVTTAARLAVRDEKT